MGNQPSASRSHTPSSNPTSPGGHGATSHAGPHHDKTSLAARDLNPRRRESIQALTVKATPAPPSASLESAAAVPVPTSSPRPHSRGRSQTITANTTAHVASQLRAAQENFKSASDDRMGNEQSRQKASHRPPAASTPQQVPTPPPPQAPASPAPAPFAHQPTQPIPAASRPLPVASPSPQTRPVDVPAGLAGAHHVSSSIEPADASQQDGFMVPPSQFSRPPRLPLPIEEEVHTPGSPIIEPTDIANAIDASEIEGSLPHRTSMLSSTTADDEDLAEEFKGPQGQPTVPTLIEWEGPGERVYVTGTFAGWNKKYKLHRNGPSKKKDVLSAYVHITPGTHHLKFIVDNDMKTSDKLPTAVDYTNILVNYLEVSYDDIPPSATDTANENKKPDSTPVQDLRAPPGIFPPQTLPPTPEIQPVQQPVVEPPKPKPRPASPRRYHQSIPKYLLDLDASEESSRFARANNAAGNLPTPPTLPMFLSKSILNGTTPMKDDSSVLIMPNHTVLNHLATSSIKDNILATSATTRYKQKFLTTIMYKPKNEDPDREH
ncbi:AMPKBI-domain-containing protein [Corynespora cassiicola Philippines]|uniref:AMPKBI-domain-containing protein n=1 Tax=Corynespora cassiicola Philippines TaxID=1448308 RepID=A0A2T2P0H0_CORCC|nr:AMPKBI-domain-containing protein [Corynespora cassiicola Philippines]